MSPQVWKTVAESQASCAAIHRSGATVGVVPTMGALHAGHLSLAEASLASTDVTVVTIFVNPTQFGPDEDLSTYPRTFDRDVEKLSALGVDAIFAPTLEEMYPVGATTSVDPPAIAKPLEGVCRPGHFRGVATIVLKLFLAIPADRAFFGQKDYQQTLVVKQMAKELNHPIEIEVMPIVREADGLAMSSRNRYLSTNDRQRALALQRILQDAKKWVAEGERCGEKISQRMHKSLATEVDKIDYALIADANTLAPWPLRDSVTSGKDDTDKGGTDKGGTDKQGNRGPQSVVALVAAYVGSTRLIDNEVFKVPTAT